MSMKRRQISERKEYLKRITECEIEIETAKEDVGRLEWLIIEKEHELQSWKDEMKEVFGKVGK